MMRMLQMVLLLGLLALSGCAGQEGAAAAAPSQDAGGQGTDTVFIPVSAVTETVQFYEYDEGAAKLRYFAVRGSDGIIRTAFDACEVCHNAGKGYSQVGSDVLCNNCGLRFRIDSLGTENKGTGCWPAYLPHEIEGDRVVMRKSDLEQGADLFP